MVDNIDYTDKEVVKKLPLTLDNVIKVCEVVLEKIKEQKIENETLLLAIGNTGCGKSTMISSLVFGPNRHELRDKLFDAVDGKKKKPKIKIIDQK